MNKTELVDHVAAAVGLTKADAGRAVDAMFDGIGSSLEKGQDVTLIGFGTFVVRARKARTGRNPQTGKEIQIAASKLPGFRAGKALKEKVNK